jgi:ligand-binding sensor domain-containing protein
VTLLAGTQHGLARSIDGGLNWQRVQIRGTPRTFYPVTALTQTPDGILYLGSNDGVYQSSTRGTQWQPFSTALPRQRVLALTTTTRRDTGTSVLFAGTEVGLYRRYADESYWRALGWAGAVPGLALHPTDPNQLYLRAAFERIYASQAALSPEPGDVAWEQRGAGMALTSEIMALAIDPTDPQVLYAGGAVELFKSTDGAQSWQRIDPPLLSGQSIFALLINPDRPTELWAGATNGLYHSMDSGASWQSSSSALENITINTLARHPTNPAILLAGTKYNGLWYTLDGGQQWQQAATLPATATIDALVIDRDDTAASADGAYGNWIYAATDHGFWRGRLPVPTPTVHAPTENAPTENAREGAAP